MCSISFTWISQADGNFGNNLFLNSVSEVSISRPRAQMSWILHRESASALLRLRDLKWLDERMQDRRDGVRGMYYSTYRIAARTVLSCLQGVSISYNTCPSNSSDLQHQCRQNIRTSISQQCLEVLLRCLFVQSLGQQDHWLYQFASNLARRAGEEIAQEGVYSSLWERRHDLNEFCKFLCKDDLFFLTTVLSNDLLQVLLVFSLSHDVEMPYQPQYYFFYVSLGFLTQFSYCLYYLPLVGPQVQALHDLFEHDVGFLAQFLLREGAEHVNHKLQEDEGLVGWPQKLQEGAEAANNDNSHLQILLYKRLHKQRDQLLTYPLNRQYQCNRAYLLHCLSLQVLFLEFLVEEGDCVQDQRFASHGRGAHRFIIIQMSEEQIAEEELKPLATRLKSIFWMVRKRAYEEVLQASKKAKSIKDELSIRGEPYTVIKFTAFLNNLVEEKHPNVLLKGLEGTETILRLDPKTGKLFNKLVVQGLERFPLLTQQRKPVLEKFLQVLELCKIDAGTLSNRLSLPQEKSVMFVIEVIGALHMDSLKGRLLEIAKKHPKKDVKELAAEIAQELNGQEPAKEEQKPKVGSARVPQKREEVKKPLKMQLIEKLAQYQQLTPKQQQAYSDQLLESIEDISNLPCSGVLSSFSLYIQLMVQSNNQIVSTNGVKMLTVLVKKDSALLGNSFPLLFLFRKFKVHKTHATNANLLALVDVLLCSSRAGDLMSAVCEGIGCQENKANLKYGCIISFIRIFSYYYRQPDLFAIYCIGEYADLYDRIENKRAVEKFLLKSFEIFSKEKEKDKEYGPALNQMRIVLGLTTNTMASQKSAKEIGRSDNKSPLMRNKSNVQNTVKAQLQSKPPLAAKTMVKTATLASPQGELGKILDLLQSSRYSEPSLKKAIDKCLECTRGTLQENMYDMYYYCEIAQSFIEKYRPNDDTDQIISHFLIDYLKILSAATIKPSKKNSRITETGLEHLLKLSTTKLVLSKELLLILNNLLGSFGFQSIVRCLGSLYVMGGLIPKKKNKKYLMRWLEENASEEFVNSQYFEVIEAIQNSGEKEKIEKKKVVGPPSIINIPSYKVTLPQIKETVKPIELPPPKKEQPESKGKKGVIQQLQLLQNADISKIQQVEEPSTDRIQQKWEYFLNKKENNFKEPTLEKSPMKAQESEDEEEKYNFSQSEVHEHEHEYYNGMEQRNAKEQFEQYPKKSSGQSSPKAQFKEESYAQEEHQSHHSSQHFDQQQDYSHNQPEEPAKEQKIEYKFLNFKKITDMMNSSNSPFNHLRTLVLLPFKSQPNKHDFLRQLTHLIQSQSLRKPQPFNSVMLLVMLLFTEINNDKTIIKPLQVLYEFMAQQCSNNEFLKLIISLYHSVIDQTQEGEQRCMVLTILTKSMTRIMPFVENALELLKDFQQFYQIGEMVYFQMFSKEYRLIREMIENSEGLVEVIYKAYEEQGESLVSIVEGWLQTGFKSVVKQELQGMVQQQF